jgi:4a-hydroxytetrahydrobiopterin dehydratase
MNLQETIRQALMEMVMDIDKSKDWGDSKQKLEKTFTFKDFNESIDFVNKVAKIAETQNHHPDITINYNKVKISITDHEKGGVSEKCHKLVKSINELETSHKEEQNEYVRTLKNARRQGVGTRFSKTAINANPMRFRPYNR